MNEADRIERAALDLVEAALAEPEDRRREWVQRQQADPRAVARAHQFLDTLDRADGQVATGGAPDDAGVLRAPDRVGAYKIVSLLGQGGMGAVFRGRRDAGDFDHEVAIKLVRPGALSDELVERFQRERQILARLSHPNIARLFDGGTTGEGGPFIVMEYVEGVPITDWADDRDLPLAERLGLFRKVCGAAAHAHQNLVIHRDITPANVLVTEEGEPKLIDFGIALPQETGAAAAEIVGAAPSLSLTPGYAAPERYLGAPATTLTDVYSLGKLLEALTGTWPDDPDLAAIVAKAAAFEPDDRYPGADALAEDVDRYLGDYPVEARQGGRRYLFGKFFVAQPGLGAGDAGRALLLIGAFAGTVYAYSRAEQARASMPPALRRDARDRQYMLFEAYDEVGRVPDRAARRRCADAAQRYLSNLSPPAAAPTPISVRGRAGLFPPRPDGRCADRRPNFGQTARAKPLSRAPGRCSNSSADIRPQRHPGLARPGARGDGRQRALFGWQFRGGRGAMRGRRAGC